MRELGLEAVTFRKKPPYRKGHVHKTFPNLVDGKFNVEKPNTVWTVDFTYLPDTKGKKNYNCTIIDLANRGVVATHTSNRMTDDIAILSLEKALVQQGYPKNLVIHSDQGTQFTSKSFTEFCENHHVIQSMSKAGCPYDNAPMERFFNTLKQELIYLYEFQNRESLEFAINEYIFGWYNTERPHTYNGGVPPSHVCS